MWQMSGPLHPKARELFKAGLYSGLNSFEELEQRIAAFDDEKRKGDSFEVFAEAYLATQRKHDAAKVWPHAAVPLEILQKLGLSEQDYGVDGVFQTLLGNHNAYQVKFRSARQPLTWRELSTFIGLADSPQIHSRILITNCDELPSVLNERRGFFCIRGSDLDRLEAEDFRAIEAWLAESAFEAPKKQPQPHQDEALSALLLALQENDRVSAIMACGTGKTLVALWTAERLQASTILVLLPSLALLRQTLHEWLRETRVPKLTYLCVCSDPTVKESIDPLTTQQSDLDFEVSTDARVVRQFFDVPFDGTKVVFSTYQSASVVGQAIKPGEMFDFGVFDEAHKTAGREGRNYAFALDDANLPIRKRLFLTATPRHYNPHQRDQEGEAQLVFSMDNPAVYGPQSYVLTFGEAAKRGIICGYKVIISVITSEMVTNEILSRGEVLVNGDAIRARQVANQIALRDAIQKYGVGKIFTFHKTVKSAASFVAAGNEGIRTHLPDFGSYHVNGIMPTARRERVMREFRGAARAVMSNARCLTEGVDVPAVDMVAFLSPRRSRVDIVQATGRAMRRSPGKSLGYVLVPLYVELATGENVEDAVSRADFDEVWDVLQSLQEQDEVLAEMIRNAGERRGQGKGFDNSSFADRIDFGGPRLCLDNLRNVVTTRCLDNLCSFWDCWIGKLKAFRDRFGHCNVAITWKEDPTLGRWVANQRANRKQGILSEERVRRLEELGFVWGLLGAQVHLTWSDRFEQLKAFKERFGHCNVAATWKEDPTFAHWVSAQRSKRKKGDLSEERIRLLDAIGFTWQHHEMDRWEDRFEEVAAFKERFGHCNVTRSWKEDPTLAQWCSTQRVYRNKGLLSKERVQQLEQLGFVWNDRREQEALMFKQFCAFKERFGHCNVEQGWKENAVLVSWVRKQRTLQNKGLLSKERFQQLDQLGFVWGQLRTQTPLTWLQRFEQLKAFKERFGHCNVTRGWKESPGLAQWVKKQRARRNKGLLSEDRIRRLEELGFVWGQPRTQTLSTWSQRFEQLCAFKNRFGHCNVKQDWEEDPGLGSWVSA